jgi:starch synthase
MRILHVATELFPYVKVGGLGDVMGALPAAQRALGADARMLLPGFSALLKGIQGLRPVWELPDLMAQGPARFLQGQSADGVPVYLLDCPPLYDRPGGPYHEAGDSHIRFAALAWAAAQLARGGAEDWRPEVVQGHDWQAGLIPAYLAQEGGPRPRTVTTIHNLAYQGVYPPTLLKSLWLDPVMFHPEGLEFYGQINFLKAGLAYADRITTVSPTYAREIQLPGRGSALEGLLAHRQRDLTGILNGVDYRIWNPAVDPLLEHHYSGKLLAAKKVNKNLLQASVGLDESPRDPLFAVISRLAEQKGLDLVLENVAYLIQLNAQLLVLGTGDPVLEAGFQAAAAAHPGRVATVVGYDEGQAHRILAGADLILVPSRQEPCGLTQLYGLRYGTLPLVRRTGGLADTVVDANAQSTMDSTATGFVFDEPSSWILGETISRACHIYRDDPRTWTQIQRHAMRQNFSWEASAREYLDLYAGM